MTEKKPSRYIPKYETVQKAFKELPIADNFRDDEYHAPVGNHLILFRKIKLKTKNGAKSKWVYDGKLMLD